MMIRKNTKKATVLWTGGKECSLALYKAKQLGYEIVNLVTFVPSGTKFQAHPIDFMKYQAESLGLPHYTVFIIEPFKESYEKAIHLLRKEHGIDTVITGDIAEVDGYPNWIRECSKYSGMDVLTPLWGWDRLSIIKELLLHEFKVIFSCVKRPWFTGDWLGKEIDDKTLKQLQIMSAENGLDICGEQGEYHTLVMDGPLFKKRIRGYVFFSFL